MSVFEARSCVLAALLATSASACAADTEDDVTEGEQAAIRAKDPEDKRALRLLPAKVRDESRGPIGELDLTYGPGSKEVADSLKTVTFTYVDESFSATSPKVHVVDSQKRKWRMKFHQNMQKTEVHSEVAANRLLWAFGFRASETYYLPTAFVSLKKDGTLSHLPRKDAGDRNDSRVAGCVDTRDESFNDDVRKSNDTDWGGMKLDPSGEGFTVRNVSLKLKRADEIEIEDDPLTPGHEHDFDNVEDNAKQPATQWSFADPAAPMRRFFPAADPANSEKVGTFPRLASANDPDFSALKIVIALIGDWDSQDANNAITYTGKLDEQGRLVQGSATKWLQVSDVGVSFGRDYQGFNRLLSPLIHDGHEGTRWDLEAFEAQTNGWVRMSESRPDTIHINYSAGPRHPDSHEDAIRHIPVDHVRTFLTRVDRSSEAELQSAFENAFLAAQVPDGHPQRAERATRYARALLARIDQLRALVK